MMAECSFAPARFPYYRLDLCKDIVRRDKVRIFSGCKSRPANSVTWPTILQNRRSASRLPFPGHVFEIAPAEAVSQAEPRGYAAIIRG